MAIIMRDYKQPNGVVYFPALLEIPSQNRLPYLYQNNPQEAMTVVSAGLTMAFETMNLVRGMNNNQVIELADMLLESSLEDNLALEDLILFLQKFVRGEYGKLYESMDIPKFMEMFEIYREERFQAMKDIREEESVQYKALPINDRIIDMFGSEKDKQREALKDYLLTKSKVQGNGTY